MFTSLEATSSSFKYPNQAVSIRDIEQLFANYLMALDDLELERWPDFFTDECLYRVTTRENWDAGYPLSTIACESVGMLEDRVASIRKTMMYAPRRYRRFSSAVCIEEVTEQFVKVRSNILVVQTQTDRASEVAFCGLMYDKIVVDDDQLKFEQRICVLDTEMIPNSLIYPI